MTKQSKVTRLWAPLTLAACAVAATPSYAQTAADNAAAAMLPAEVSVDLFPAFDNPISAFSQNVDTHTFTTMKDGGSNYVLHIAYTELGDWGGTEVEFLGDLPRDWTGNTTLDFRFKGTNSGNTYTVEIREGGADSGSSEEWRANLVDDSADWKDVSLNLATDFALRADWQPCGDDPAVCNGTLDLTNMQGFVINEILPDVVGSYAIDAISLDGGAVSIASFDFANPLGSFENASPEHMVSVVDGSGIPNADVTNMAGAVSYEGQTDWGGTAVDFDVVQDWSAGFETFGFWFKGTNSGLTYVVELREGGSNAGDSEQWRAPFVDTSADWTFVSLSLTDHFVLRADWQPCNADPAVCDGVFNKAAVYGFAINTPLDTTGSYEIDTVMLNADMDLDGVFDAVDECLGTPADEAGFDAARGCSPSQTDEDNDGVFSSLDTCPNTTAEELAIGVDAEGCVYFDNDNDGVWDNLGEDQCLGSDSLRYVVDTDTGCYADLDDDGLVGPADACEAEDIPSGTEEISRRGEDGCIMDPPVAATGSIKGSSSLDLFALVGLFGLGVAGFRRRK